MIEDKGNGQSGEHFKGAVNAQKDSQHRMNSVLTAIAHHPSF